MVIAFLLKATSIDEIYLVESYATNITLPVYVRRQGETVIVGRVPDIEDVYLLNVLVRNSTQQKQRQD